MDNATRFLNAYSSVEKSLNQIEATNDYVPVSTLIVQCAKKNHIVKNNLETLREYCELRNAIVHHRGTDQEIIAQPTDGVVEDFERIAKLLQKDDSIMQYASSPVQTLPSSAKIPEAFQLMQSLKTSKLPIYDEGHFVGVITMENLAKWSIEKGDLSACLKDLLTVDSNKNVVFFSRDHKVQDVVDAFENSMKKGVQLRAILVTDSGKKEDVPVGIITLYDLPKILADFL